MASVLHKYVIGRLVEPSPILTCARVGSAKSGAPRSFTCVAGMARNYGGGSLPAMFRRAEINRNLILMSLG